MHQGRLYNQVLGKDIVTGNPILYEQVCLCEFVLVYELGRAMLLQNTCCAIAVVHKTVLHRGLLYSIQNTEKYRDTTVCVVVAAYPCASARMLNRAESIRAL